VGANCGAGFDAFTALCRRFRASTSLPIWIKPNAGLPELAGGTLTYRSSPEQFGAVIPAYVEAGATYIGGCCGTSPAFIRAAADVLREMRTTQATA
jgi:methionine synthase I (cobalamin-dependent)